MILFFIFLIEKPIEPDKKILKKVEELKEFGTMKFLMMGGIKIYQFSFSEMQGDVCNFEPSCSNYAFEAIEEYGPIVGLLLAADRLERCSPFTFLYAGKYYKTGYVKGRGIKVLEKPSEIMNTFKK